MVREQGPFKTRQSVAADRLVVDRRTARRSPSSWVFSCSAASNRRRPALGTWTAICRALGITADIRPADEPQPPLRTPVTHRLDERHARPDRQRQRRARRVCRSQLHRLPRRARGEPSRPLPRRWPGWMRVAIYKQLDDFRAGKRSWGAMNAIAKRCRRKIRPMSALTSRAAPMACRPSSASIFKPGIPFGRHDPAIRLALPATPRAGFRLAPPVTVPATIKLGAPQLKTQQPAYIERQLAAFAQGLRRNDINEQMRTIAMQLTAAEMHAVAELYGSGKPTQVAQR